MREHAGIFDLSAFAIFDVNGAGALEALQRSVLAQVDVPVGQGRLHAGAQPGRRLQVRPHDHAARRRSVPGRHRRRARDGRPQALPRPASRATDRRRSSTSPPPGRRSACGAHAHATSLRPSPRTTSRTRASRSAPAGRSRSARSSCSRRGSRTSATSAGSSTCRSSRARASGTSSGRRAGSQPHRVRDRRVRHDRPPGEVLPGVRRRARDRVRRRRGGNGPAASQGAGLHRQGGAPPSARRGARSDPVHPHDRRSHLGGRGQALPPRPRADHVARRHAVDRSEGPPLVRDERRGRAVGGQVHPAGRISRRSTPSSAPAASRSST